jgi:hypothetical protein
MEKNALHIWPRGKFMMIALPNPKAILRVHYLFLSKFLIALKPMQIFRNFLMKNLPM